MKNWRKWVAALMAVAMLLSMALAEEAPQEIELVLTANGAEAGGVDINGIEANDGAVYQPVTEEAEVDPAGKAKTHAMKVDDTCRVRVTGGYTLTGCTASKKDAVSVSPIMTDAVGPYIDVKAVKAAKKVKLTVSVTGGKKKKGSLTLEITDPYVPDSIRFMDFGGEVPMGSTLDLNDFVVVTPAHARKNFNWKGTGGVKVDAKGVMTAVKAGKGTVTVTAAANKKVKATVNVQVLANSVKNLNGKPGAGDYAGISGKWSLWPVSLEVNKKGTVDCQMYVLNATGEKATQIENLTVTVSGGTYANVLATGTLGSVKAAAANNNCKLVKLTLQPTAAMGDAFLPDYQKADTLFFAVNSAETQLKCKSGRFPYAPTKIPAAETGPTNPDDFNAVDGVIRSYNGDGGDITIPAVGSDGIPIVEIGPGAFKGYTAITGVTMPDTITLIRYDAFENCTGLKFVRFSSSLETIEQFAFNGCTSLDNVVFPNTLKNIYSCAFQNCSAISALDFPASLTYIPNTAFNGCNSVTKLHIPKTMGDDVDDTAFLGMGGVLEFTVDPESTRFSTVNKALASLDGTEIIAAPCGTTGLYAVPEGVLSIGYCAFSGGKFSAISLPESLRFLGRCSFGYCKNLTEMTIPWQITGLPTELFAGCSNLEKVTFYGYVYKWGDSVFLGCDNLTTFAGFDNSDIHRIADNDPHLTFQVIPDR